jgi:hypothetical protein
VSFRTLVLIVHSTQARVMLQTGELGWRAPELRDDGTSLWFDVRRVQRGVAETLGLFSTVLRCVAGDDNADPSTTRVYCVEGHDPSWSLPEGAQWLGLEALAKARLQDEGLRDTIEAALEDLGRADAVASRVAWTRRGWYAAAMQFVAEVLARHELRQAGEPEQERGWQRSYVLRVPTDRGSVYFKAAPELYGHEPAVTQFLSSAFPGRFPAVLGIDLQRGFLVLQEAGGVPLVTTDDLGIWESTVAGFARLQISCTRRVGDLLDVGCPDLRLGRVAERAQAMVADRDAQLVGQPHGLTREEADQVASFAPELQRNFAALDALGIPASLEHGDLRSVHLSWDVDGMVCFDLSDCAVSHPFFSAVTLLDFEALPGEETHRKEVNQRLVRAYLEPWTEILPMETLLRGYSLARLLAIPYAAVVRYDIILPHIEPVEKWSFMIPFWLKRMLRAKDSNSQNESQ